MNRIHKFFLPWFALLALLVSSCQTTTSPMTGTSLPAMSAPTPVTEPLPVLPALEDPKPTPTPVADLESVLAPIKEGIHALFKTDQVEISKELIQSGQVGDVIRYTLEIYVKKDLQGLRVSETVPEAVRFLTSKPTATKEGSTYFWDFGSLAAGDTQEISVSVEALAEGDHKIDSEISVDNALSMQFYSGQPQLEVAKSGPPTIELNEQGTWSVTVTNSGSATARDVIVEDLLPVGLQAVGEYEFALGNLEPDTSRSVEVTAQAIKQGSFINTASANYEKGPQAAEGSVPVNVVQSGIRIKKSGPQKAYVFKPESFQISIQNTGDTDLQNVRITDYLPAGSTVADNGRGRVKDNAIGWVIPRLPAGASQLITTQIAATKPGIATNRVSLLTATGLEANDSHNTEWLAVPGVTISITDTKDPIRVGETTQYAIQVRNQGDFEPVSGTVILQFRDTIKPIATKGDAQGLIEGQTVTFPRTTLEPGKDINLSVTAQGARIGPGRAVLNFTADFLNEPVISQEATNVY